MVNNYEKIKELMEFKTPDDFYYVQVMKRKKDDVDGVWRTDCNNIILADYYIKSFEDFDKKFFDMKGICDALNSRAYIHLNKRSFVKTAKETMKKIVNNVANGDFEACKSSYNKCCGKFSNTKDKKWLIDFDYDEPNKSFSEFYSQLKFELSGNVRPIGTDKVVSLLPTKNGFHVITTSFDCKFFIENTELNLKEQDIKKDSPTLLYYGGK